MNNIFIFNEGSLAAWVLVIDGALLHFLIFFLRKTRHMQTVNRARMITVIMMIFTTRIMIIMIIIDDDRYDETTATTL